MPYKKASKTKREGWSRWVKVGTKEKKVSVSFFLFLSWSKSEGGAFKRAKKNKTREGWPFGILKKGVVKGGEEKRLAASREAGKKKNEAN